jgi:uncharacterized damage-inducible protein DinB
MDLREYIGDSLKLGRERTLGVVNGLTPEQMVWRPGPDANSIIFLVWHIARSEDGLYNQWVEGREQVWTAGGWDKRFGLKPEDSGREWTSQQVADFSPPSLEELLQYMDEVRESVLGSLPNLDLSRLGEKPHPGRPDWTKANLLQLLIFHEAHHQGAMEYLIGLQKSGA